MVQSAEHEFLSNAILDILEQSAKSELFTCKETGRKRFDFTCDLTRDWSKAVAGQTLWRHDRDGIDKDLRTLLLDGGSAAAVYVARDSMATRARISEVIDDFKESPVRPALAKLRVFWVPGDFDADDGSARSFVRSSLRRDIGNDLLLRIVLGGLTARDVRIFSGSTRLGFSAWLLARLAHDGFHNLTAAKKKYKYGVPTLKEELQRLELIDMIRREQGTFVITEKGYAMLDICARLHAYWAGQAVGNEEFLYICELLGIRANGLLSNGAPAGFEALTDAPLPPFSNMNTSMRVLTCLYHASRGGDPLDWSFPRGRIVGQLT